MKKARAENRKFSYPGTLAVHQQTNEGISSWIFPTCSRFVDFVVFRNQIFYSSGSYVGHSSQVVLRKPWRVETIGRPRGFRRAHRK